MSQFDYKNHNYSDVMSIISEYYSTLQAISTDINDAASCLSFSSYINFPVPHSMLQTAGKDYEELSNDIKSSIIGYQNLDESLKNEAEKQLDLAIDSENFAGIETKDADIKLDNENDSSKLYTSDTPGVMDVSIPTTEEEKIEIDSSQLLAMGKGPINPKLLEDDRLPLKEAYNHAKELKLAGFTDDDIARIINSPKEYEEATKEMENEIFQEYLNGDDRRFRKLMEAKAFQLSQFNREELESTKEQILQEESKMASTIKYLEDEIDLYTDVLEHSFFDEENSVYTYKMKSKLMKFNSIEEFNKFINENNDLIEYSGYDESTKEYLVKTKSQTLELTQEQYEGIKGSKEYYESLQKKYLESITKLRETRESLEEYINSSEGKSNFTFKNWEELDKGIEKNQKEIGNLVSALFDNRFTKNLQAIVYLMGSKGLSYEEVCDMSVGYIDLETGTIYYYDTEIVSNGTQTGELKSTGPLLGEDKNPNHYNLTFKDVFGSKEELQEFLGFFKEKETEDGKKVHVLSNKTTRNPRYSEILYNKEEVEQGTVDKEKILKLVNDTNALLYAKERINNYIDRCIEYGKYCMQPDFAEKSVINKGELVALTTSERYLGINDNSKIEYRQSDKFRGAVLARVLNGDATINTVMGGNYLQIKDNKTGTIQSFFIGSPGIVDTLMNYQKWISEDAIKENFEDEIKIFTYICNTEGYDKGYEFLKTISNGMDEMFVSIETQRDSTTASNQYLAPWLRVYSWIYSPIKSLQNLSTTMHRKEAGEDLYLTGIYNPADTWNQEISKFVRNTLGDTLGDIADITNSMGQSATNTIVSYALGGTPIASIVSSFSVMGSTVFNNTLYQAKQKGLSDNRALALATLYAITETGMEAYSVSHLLNIDSYLNKALTSGSLMSKVASLTGNIGNEHARSIAGKILTTGFCLLSQGAIEGEEEWSTEVLDNLWDYLLSGDKSNYATIYDNYKMLHPGCSDAEASIATLQEIGNQSNRAGLSGFVSGMLFGIVGSGGGNSINLQNDINLTSMENIEMLKGKESIGDRLSDIWDKGKVTLEKAKEQLYDKVPTMWSSLFDSLHSENTQTNTIQTTEWLDTEILHGVIMPLNNENSAEKTLTIETIKNFMEAYPELTDKIVERARQKVRDGDPYLAQFVDDSYYILAEGFIGAISIDEINDLLKEERRQNYEKLDAIRQPQGQIDWNDLDSLPNIEETHIIEELRQLKIAKLAQLEQFETINGLLDGFSLSDLTNPTSSTTPLTKIFESLEKYSDSNTTRNIYFKLCDYIRLNNNLEQSDAISILVSAMKYVNNLRGYDSSTIKIDGQDIAVYTQKNLRNNSKSAIDIEAIAERLDSLPDVLKKFLPKRIYIYDTFNPDDLSLTYDEEFGTHGEFTSGMTADYGIQVISIYSAANDVDSLIHEIAHLIDKEHIYSTSEEWKIAMQKDLKKSKKKSCTEYGETKESEDFAESIEQYYVNSEEFRKIFPNRAAYLDNLLEQLDSIQEATLEQEALNLPTGDEVLILPTGDEILNLPAGDEILNLPAGDEVLNLPAGDEVLKLYPGENNTSTDTKTDTTDTPIMTTQTTMNKTDSFGVTIDGIFFPFLKEGASAEEINVENTVVDFMRHLKEKYPQMYQDIMGDPEFDYSKYYISIIGGFDLKTLKELLELEEDYNNLFVWNKAKDPSIRELLTENEENPSLYDVKLYLMSNGLFSPSTAVKDFCQLVAAGLAMDGDYESIAEYGLLPNFELRSIDTSNILERRDIETNNQESIKELLTAAEKYYDYITTEYIYFSLYDELTEKYGYDQKSAIELITYSMEKVIQERGFDTTQIEIDGKKIYVFTQKNLRTSGQSISIEDIAKTLDSLPESMKAFIPETITIYDTFDSDNLESTFNEELNPSGERFESAMAASYLLKSMHIFAGAIDTDDIIHEMAHLMDIDAKFSKSSEWQTAMEEDLKISGLKSRTSYGETMPQEDFAESLKYYFKEKEEFIKNFPNRAAYIENLLNNYELSNEEVMKLASGELIKLTSGEEILRLPAGDEVLNLPPGDEVLHLPSGEENLTREETIKGYLEDPLTEEELERIEEIDRFSKRYRIKELELYPKDEESKRTLLRLIHSDKLENLDGVLKELIDTSIKHNDIDFIKDINLALYENEAELFSAYLYVIYPQYHIIYDRICNGTFDIDTVKKEFSEKSMQELAKEIHSASLYDEESFKDMVAGLSFLVLSNSEERIKAMALLKSIPYLASENIGSSTIDYIVQNSTSNKTALFLISNLSFDKIVNDLNEEILDEEDPEIFRLIQSELKDSFDTSLSFIKETMDDVLSYAGVSIETTSSVDTLVTIDDLLGTSTTSEIDWREPFYKFYQDHPEQMQLFKYAISFAQKIDENSVNADTLLSLVKALSDLSEKDYSYAARLLSLSDLEDITVQQAETFINHYDIFMDPDYDYLTSIYGTHIYKDGDTYYFFSGYGDSEILDSDILKIHVENMRYLDETKPDEKNDYVSAILRRKIDGETLLKINSLESISESLKKKMMLKLADIIIEEDDKFQPASKFDHLGIPTIMSMINNQNEEVEPASIQEMIDELEKSSNKTDAIICSIIDMYGNRKEHSINSMAAVYMAMNENEELMSFLKAFLGPSTNKTVYNKLLELNPELANKYFDLNIEDDVLKAINGQSNTIRRTASGEYYINFFNNNTGPLIEETEDISGTTDSQAHIKESINKIIEAIKQQPNFLDYMTKIGNRYQSIYSREAAIKYMLNSTDQFIQNLNAMNEINDINPEYVDIFIRDYYNSNYYPDKTNIEIFKDPNFESLYEMFGAQLSIENGEYKYYSPSRWDPNTDWYENPSKQIFVPSEVIQQHIENYELIQELNNQEATDIYLKLLRETDDLAHLADSYSTILNSTKIDNIRKTTILSYLDKINDNILTSLVNYLDNNTEKIESQEYFDNVVNAILDIASFKESNSLELRNFADIIGEKIWESKDPYDMVKKIKEIFEKNNLPTIAKIYKVFELRDGDWKKIQDCTSPILQETGNLRRKTIILTDLVKTFMGSNNRSMKSYLENLEFGSSIFEKIKDDSFNYDSLTDSEKEELTTFKNHLLAMYNNTLKGKYDASMIGNSGDVVADIKELALRISPNNSLDYNIGDRLVSMFMGTAGIDTVEQAKSYMKQKVEEAEARNIETSKQPLTLKNGDLIRGIRVIDYLGIILQNGSLCQEFLGFNAGGDMTPFDIDLRIVQNATGIFSKDYLNTMADGYGPIYIVLKNDSRYQTTRSENIRTDENYDPSKYELFNTLGYTQMGIRTGIASTDIDAIVMMDYNPKVGLEIAKNGFYIPVADTTGAIVFTYEDYLELRKKMTGLSHYDSDAFELSSNLDSGSVREVEQLKTEDIKQTTAKEEYISSLITEALKDSKVVTIEKVSKGFSADLTDSIAELYSTGSTSRNTNVPNDSDFDYVLKVDNSIYLNKTKLNELTKELKVKLGLDDINGRLDGKIIDKDGNELDVQISIVPRTDRVEFSTDVALSEKLEAIKEQYPEQYEKVLANIVLAKQLMKKANAYKSLKSGTGEGGLGGIGIENWILQNGGSLHDAAEDFLRVAEECGMDFDKFKEKYHVFDLGENHYSIEKGFYAHDDFVGDFGKMTDLGFHRMVDALQEYLANETLIEEVTTIPSSLDGNKLWTNYTSEDLDKKFEKVEKDGVTYYIANGEDFKFLVHVIDTNGDVKPNGSTQEQLEKIKFLQRNLAEHPELFMESVDDSNYVLSCSTISDQGMQTFSYALLKNNGQVILGFNEDNIENVYGYCSYDAGIDRDQRPTKTSETVWDLFEEPKLRLGAGNYDEVDIKRKSPAYIISMFSPEDTINNANNIKWAQEYGIPIVYINKNSYITQYKQQLDSILNKLNNGECLTQEEDLKVKSIMASIAAIDTNYIPVNLNELYLKAYEQNSTKENADKIFELDEGNFVTSNIFSSNLRMKNIAWDAYINHFELDAKYPFLSKDEIKEILQNASLKGQDASMGHNLGLWLEDLDSFAKLIEPLSRGECLGNDDYHSIQKIYDELKENKILSSERYNELKNELLEKELSAFEGNPKKENADNLFSLDGGALIHDLYIRTALSKVIPESAFQSEIGLVSEAIRQDINLSIYDAIIKHFSLDEKYPNLSRADLIKELIEVASIPRDGPNYNFSFDFELKYLKEHADELIKQQEKNHERYQYTLLSIEEVWKDPEEFIIPDCMDACKILWDKGIVTTQCSNEDNLNRWIEIDYSKLSEENKMIIDELVNTPNSGFSLGMNKDPSIMADSIGEEASKILCELAQKLKSQDTTQFISAEEYLARYKCQASNGTSYFEIKDNGDAVIAENPERVNATLEEALEANKDTDLYVESEGRVYNAKYALDIHNKFLLNTSTTSLLEIGKDQYRVVGTLSLDDVKFLNNLKNRTTVVLDSTKGLTSELLSQLTNDKIIISIKGGLDYDGISKYNSNDYIERTYVTPKALQKIIEYFEYNESFIDPSWNDFEKAMFLYSALAEDMQYEQKYDSILSPGIVERSLNGVLYGKLVCAGFAYVYKEMLDRVGIKNYYQNQQHVHAFNIIEIDGKQYGVDVTWDNTSKKDNNGRCGFKWFGRYNTEDFYSQKGHQLYFEEAENVFYNIEEEDPVKIKKYDKEETIYDLSTISQEQMDEYMSHIESARLTRNKPTFTLQNQSLESKYQYLPVDLDYMHIKQNVEAELPVMKIIEFLKKQGALDVDQGLLDSYRMRSAFISDIMGYYNQSINLQELGLGDYTLSVSQGYVSLENRISDVEQQKLYQSLNAWLNSYLDNLLKDTVENVDSILEQYEYKPEEFDSNRAIHSTEIYSRLSMIEKNKDRLLKLGYTEEQLDGIIKRINDKYEELHKPYEIKTTQKEYDIDFLSEVFGGDIKEVKKAMEMDIGRTLTNEEFRSNYKDPNYMISLFEKYYLVGDDKFRMSDYQLSTEELGTLLKSLIASYQE